MYPKKKKKIEGVFDDFIFQGCSVALLLLLIFTGSESSGYINDVGDPSIAGHSDSIVFFF